MRMQDCDICDEVFTHVDPDDGTVRHFNATKMDEAAEFLLVAGRVSRITVAMDSEFVRRLPQLRGLEYWRLARLVDPYLHKPILGAVIGDTVLTVDGHHRMFMLHGQGARTYEMYLFPEETWRGFLVTDIPEERAAILLEGVGGEHG